jgi:hypothetical protein
MEKNFISLRTNISTRLFLAQCTVHVQHVHSKLCIVVEPTGIGKFALEELKFCRTPADVKSRCTYHELDASHLRDGLPDVGVDYNLLQDLQAPHLALHVVRLCWRESAILNGKNGEAMPPPRTKFSPLQRHVIFTTNPTFSLLSSSIWHFSPFSFHFSLCFIFIPFYPACSLFIFPPPLPAGRIFSIISNTPQGRYNFWIFISRSNHLKLHPKEYSISPWQSLCVYSILMLFQ